MTRVYCHAVCTADEAGNEVPSAIVWQDNRTFKIDRVIHVTENASPSETYTRYVISIAGQQKVLFQDQKGWFVYM